MPRRSLSTVGAAKITAKIPEETAAPVERTAPTVGYERIFERIPALFQGWSVGTAIIPMDGPTLGSFTLVTVRQGRFFFFSSFMRPCPVNGYTAGKEEKAPAGEVIAGAESWKRVKDRKLPHRS